MGFVVNYLKSGTILLKIVVNGIRDLIKHEKINRPTKQKLPIMD